MNQARISYIVLNCSDLERSREFYEKLGFVFTAENHHGTLHYSTKTGAIVWELYPLPDDQHVSPQRFGIDVVNLESVINLLNDRNIIKGPFKFNGDVKAFVRDPDNRFIELTEKLVGDAK